MRGKIKLTIDLDRSLPIDTEMNRQQKLLVRELLSKYSIKYVSKQSLKEDRDE